MTDPATAGSSRWVDVHEAAAAADVSVTSIRNWYRGPDPEIPSRMERGEDGRQRRVMPLDAVLERAKSARGSGAAAPDKKASGRTGAKKGTGRKRAGSGRKSSKRSSKKSAKKAARKSTKELARTGAGRTRKSSGTSAPGERRSPVVRKSGRSPRPGQPRTMVRTPRRDAAADQEELALDTPRIEDGRLPVPLTAWDRVMGQLGNLHEIGKELATAEARAARSETEAKFHSARVTELRAELEELREQLTALEEERDAAKLEAEEARRERDVAHNEHERTRIDRDHIQRQLDEARREHQEFTQALQASREIPDPGRRRWFS